MTMNVTLDRISIFPNLTGEYTKSRVYKGRTRSKLTQSDITGQHYHIPNLRHTPDKRRLRSTGVRDLVTEPPPERPRLTFLSRAREARPSDPGARKPSVVGLYGNPLEQKSGG